MSALLEGLLVEPLEAFSTAGGVDWDALAGLPEEEENEEGLAPWCEEEERDAGDDEEEVLATSTVEPGGEEERAASPADCREEEEEEADRVFALLGELLPVGLVEASLSIAEEDEGDAAPAGMTAGLSTEALAPEEASAGLAQTDTEGPICWPPWLEGFCSATVGRPVSLALVCPLEEAAVEGLMGCAEGGCSVVPLGLAPSDLLPCVPDPDL